MSKPLAATDFGQGVSDAFADVMTFLPKLAAFLVILLIGYFVAKALSKAVNAVLERVGFDRAVERGGIAQAMSHSKYDASDIVAKIVYYAVFLLALQMAFGVFGPNPISDLIKGVVAFLPKLFVAILIVVVAAAIAKAVKDIITGALGGLSYGNLLGTIASVFILGLGVIAALNQIQVAVTVTNTLLIAIMATVGGILVVGVGGGLIRPMQQRWEQWLTHAERESGNMRQQIQSNKANQPYPSEPGSTDRVRTYAQSAPTGQGAETSQSYGTPTATAGGYEAPGSYRSSEADTQQFRSPGR